MSNTLDPKGLASYAKKLKAQEESSSDLRKADGFTRTFVVTDVDEFTIDSLRKADEICGKDGLGLIISNPCLEIWLIDHVQSCADAFTMTKGVEKKAAELGLLEGNRNKCVVYGKLQHGFDSACNNASRHNTEERRKIRKQLGSTDFAPWTDMPEVIREFEQ